MNRVVRMTMDEILQDSEASDLRLAALADKSDSEIDLSDIPEAGDDFWQNARPMREIMEERQAARAEQGSIKLDRDVLQWLEKEDGSQVEARANALLRDVMINKERKSA
jgi:uncharacterized protein (DUF4415 family)